MLSQRYTGCVYLATNETNGRAYIGKTIMELCDRKASHVHTAARKTTLSMFHKAIRKYGADAFRWERLFQSDDEAALFDAERQLIADYRNCGFSLYNLGGGGEGQSVPCTAERRAKVSAAMKGRSFSAEHRANLSRASKGKPKSKDHAEKIRQSKIGRILPPWTEERRAKCAATLAAKLRAAKA